MLSVEKPKEGYLVHVSNGEYIVCKILESFDNEEEALDKLVDLLNNK
ncbi:MAG: hypothetical protein ACRDD7_09395 [Peptostreptococcaceae bacterium]